MTESFAVRNGALVRVPVFESHHRGRNWAAVIAEDPRSPGGLKRTFLPRAHGSFYYMIDGLCAGDPVEFGADYYTTAGRRRACRWYGVVIGITHDHVILNAYQDAAAAIAAAPKGEQHG